MQKTAIKLKIPSKLRFSTGSLLRMYRKHRGTVNYVGVVVFVILAIVTFRDIVNKHSAILRKDFNVRFRETFRAQVKETIKLEENKVPFIIYINQKQSAGKIADFTPVTDIELLDAKGSKMKYLRLPFAKTRLILSPFGRKESDYISLYYTLNDWGKSDGNEFDYAFSPSIGMASVGTRLQISFEHGYVRKIDCFAGDIACDQKLYNQEVVYSVNGITGFIGTNTKVVWNSEFVGTRMATNELVDLIRVYWMNVMLLILIIVVVLKMYKSKRFES